METKWNAYIMFYLNLHTNTHACVVLPTDDDLWRSLPVRRWLATGRAVPDAICPTYSSAAARRRPGTAAPRRWSAARRAADLRTKKGWRICCYWATTGCVCVCNPCVTGRNAVLAGVFVHLAPTERATCVISVYFVNCTVRDYTHSWLPSLHIRYISSWCAD